MSSEISFAIDPEELAGLALNMANTFSPMGHEQPLADLVYEWLSENDLNAYQQTASLKAAIELDIFTAIGEGSRTSQKLSERCRASSGLRTTRPSHRTSCLRGN